VTYALGIDLGTTFTAAAVSRKGRVEIVGMGNHASSIPSAVLLREDGELLVGDAATRRGQHEPARLAREFKRRLGDATPIILGHTPYSSERLMAAVVRYVVDTVGERQGGPPNAVTIAHPANWGPYKRELLEQAATVAGVTGARFVTEPEAAAVHFAAGERVDEGGIVAVYDLGGGTFDAAVMRRVGDRFVTMGEPQGIERLGGIDFDEAVMSHVRATVGDALTQLDGNDPVVRSGMIRLRGDCIAAKEALSADSEAVIPVLLPGLQTQVRITRPEFENMIRPVLRETVDMLRRALQLAAVTPDQLSAVVLAGGSSRIPLVAEMVSGALGRPVSVDAHPKDTVAMGAARLAASADAHAPAASQISAPTPVVSPTTPSPAPPTAPVTAQPPPTRPTTPAAPTRPGPGSPTPHRPAPATQRLESLAPPSRGRRGEITLAAAILLVAIGIGAFLLLRGGGDEETDPPDTAAVQSNSVPVVDDGGQPDTEAPEETEASDSTEPAQIHRCTAATGRCVFLDEITREGDTFIARYTTVGYDPKLQGGPESRHVHFYFDTLSVDQAGIPAPPNWVAYDTDEDGNLIYRFEASSVPPGATKLCASVANVNHGLDDHLQDCEALP
jgi:actin-like ATPase involved in cell morphogenesis